MVGVGNNFTAQEMGFPFTEATGPQGMPPGDGGLTTPNFLTFSALVRSAARAYLYTFDEALRDSPANARAMRRDPIIMGALRARQRPTAQLSWHITPQDETNPAEAEAAKIITYVVEKIPKFQKLKMKLLEAIYFGKYAVECAYEWKPYKGRNTLFVRDFIPINGDKIRFRWDGVPGFLVYAEYPGTKEATDYGLAHFLTASERLQYIIHEHEPDDVDWLEPEMAGAIHGVGVRGVLYWFWWLKQQIFALLMNYLKRFSNGLTVFYYDGSNPQAQAQAETAARQQFSSTAILYPRFGSQNPDRNKVERLEVSTASPALLDKLVTDYFDDAITKYILGQSLSHDTAPTGLGSGVARLHQETLDEIIKYDAVDLAETLQTDLIDVLYQYNAPGIPPGKFEFEIDSPNSEELMQYGQILYEWGVPLDEDQVYKISQWQKPKPGSGIVTQLGPMQPAAIGGVQGVPVAGQAGPPGQLSPEQMAEIQSTYPQGMPQGPPSNSLAYARKVYSIDDLPNRLKRKIMIKAARRRHQRKRMIMS